MRRSVAYWLALALALALDAWLPHVPGVLRADFGATAVVLVVSFLGSLFGFFGGRVPAEVRRGLTTLRDGLVALGRELVALAKDTGRILAIIAGALRRFWSQILRPLLLKLDAWIRRAFQWLRDTFGPLLRLLRELRDWILRLYNRWLKPIFDTIDMLRRILGILGRFNVGWARALDAKLAELEEELLRPIRFVLGKINELIDVVDRIVTVDGLLQRYTLIRSLIAHQRDALAVWWTSIHRPLAGEKRAEYDRPIGTRPLAAVASDLRAYVIDHSGPDAGRIDEHAADLALRLRAVDVIVR